MIFYIHGGGFTGGDKADGKYWCPYFASKGMVAASVNHTLLKEGTKANLNTMFHELRHTAQVISKICNEKGIELNEMATTGISAGGCLALLYAYREPEKSPIPVKFVFEQTGPASFEPSLWNKNKQEHKNKDKVNFVYAMTGKEFAPEQADSEEYRQAIREISPTDWVNQNSVPTILGYGAKDKVVPTIIIPKLLEKLTQHKVEHTYIEFPNSGHGLLSDPDKTEEFYKAIDLYIKKYFENH